MACKSTVEGGVSATLEALGFGSWRLTDKPKKIAPHGRSVLIKRLLYNFAMPWLIGSWRPKRGVGKWSSSRRVFDDLEPNYTSCPEQSSPLNAGDAVT
jgi:hypothetical protein